MLRSCKSQFGEKNTVLPNEKFPSLTTKECDNVTTLSFKFDLLSVNWSFKGG